ncbi:MAG TPA: MBL fold metallo-hydrolase [Solirubrobacteraceae bacterium]|nr:MBL fold metallo-hydrolase [Solirubrobacteraceae bacterium]
MLERNAVEQVHRVEDARVNWYLVEEAGRVLVVDTGHPGSWRSLRRSLQTLGYGFADIEAIVLTHGHFDHMGFARRAQSELGLDVWAPAGDSAVQHPWRYSHEDSRLPYLRHPYFVRTLAEMTAFGALGVRGLAQTRTFRDGDRLDLPGHPKAIATPGHSEGHCSLVFEDRGALLAGDAFVMVDPYTGRPGPCLVAGAATADSRQALSSVELLAGLSATTALTGHGAPWRGAIGEAATRVREAAAAR